MKKSNIVKRFVVYFIKGVGGILEIFIALIFVLLIYIILVSDISEPTVPKITIGERQKVGENHYVLGNNWLKKNEFGIWEMYIEGAPYERGVIYGKLAKELIQKQERIFVDQINHFVPSSTWQQFLRLMVGFFNKDLPNNIPLENQQEIYGISRSFSDEYNYIAPKYDRILNYHAAHDIGHALNDYSMVGCTSFALRNEKTEDGGLLIGRNFDFYVGDEFAEEKIVLFVKPDKGHAFASYSWAGFTGVVSGLNDVGLSVTINASKSDLPTSSKTPISLLAREILQYAETIDEAIVIAKKRKTFVSETLMISSKKDGKAVLIEKSPAKLGVYDSGTDILICSNHYQSTTFSKDPINIENIRESDSKYRYDRMKMLIGATDLFTPEDAARVLRDQHANNGDTLGMGNPRAINQLIAHHSVIIQPELERFYISTQNYQLGTYVAYDLNEFFKRGKATRVGSIHEDVFVNSKAYRSFKHFKAIKSKISHYVNFGEALNLTPEQVQSFIASNSELYITYEMLGRYYMTKGNTTEAQKYFKRALQKNLASESIREELTKLLLKCQK